MGSPLMVLEIKFVLDTTINYTRNEVFRCPKAAMTGSNIKSVGGCTYRKCTEHGHLQEDQPKQSV